ncbi:hypothetical protein RUND412_010772, partial [Rhizina undulata]
MVFFSDLTSSEQPHDLHWRQFMLREHEAVGAISADNQYLHHLPPDADRPNPNFSHPLSAVTALYPFLTSLAIHLDHNDLSSLSSTCRQIQANMMQYRSTLLAMSLRCRNYLKNKEVNRDWSPQCQLRQRRWGPTRKCAGDLVEACWMCREPICRNCVRQPFPAHHHHRQRRLCVPCTSTPLVEPLPPVCRCASNTWLCEPCLVSSSRDYELYSKWWGAWIKAPSEKWLEEELVVVKCPRGRACVGVENRLDKFTVPEKMVAPSLGAYGRAVAPLMRETGRAVDVVPEVMGEDNM